jgi:serine/threonine protein kinase
MSLPVGRRLGPYEIVAPVGARGMGEVYRARDTRLERTVAVKIIPEPFAADPELKQRFVREAQTISSFSHPHICHLYDVGEQDGTNYIVMEYLEGETLASRLAKGPIPIQQVLKIGGEIADALDKAHRQGVIHRDLKPANVMLTKSGAKLMDFGLAKSVKATAVAVSGDKVKPITVSTPTALESLAKEVSPLTQKGTVVGTFQYMAPEVLQGADADARSDIFSLGCVLYEMITGKRAFEGKSQLSVLAAILEKDPEPVSQVQPLAPPSLDLVVKSCLAKDQEERIQTAHDLKLQLQWSSQSTSAIPILPKRHSRTHDSALWITACIVLVLAIGGFILLRNHAPADVIDAVILPPDKLVFDDLGDYGGPAAVSPDGKMIAFAGLRMYPMSRTGPRFTWRQSPAMAASGRFL